MADRSEYKVGVEDGVPVVTSARNGGEGSRVVVALAGSAVLNEEGDENISKTSILGDDLRYEASLMERRSCGCSTSIGGYLPRGVHSTSLQSSAQTAARRSSRRTRIPSKNRATHTATIQACNKQEVEEHNSTFKEISREWDILKKRTIASGKETGTWLTILPIRQWYQIIKP
jgi:hypothetical protein